MDKGNYLNPRLIALAKDTALYNYFEKWDNSITFNFIKEAMFNGVDISDKISIKKEFSHIEKKDLSLMLEQSYENSLSLIKHTLKFVGRTSDSYIEKIEL